MRLTPSTTARRFKPKQGAQYKLIYLARRNPSLTAEEFPDAWRSHAELAGQFAATLGKHFLGSRQCVKYRLAELPSLFDNHFDGATILSLKSWDDLLAARYHPHALDELQHDEGRVFAGPVDDWTMAVEETIIVDGAPGDHALLAFLAPGPTDSAEFASLSLAAAKRLVPFVPSATRILWNHVIDPAANYPFAAVLEVWFANCASASEAARDPRVIAALEQPDAADRHTSSHVFARLNTAVREGAN